MPVDTVEITNGTDPDKDEVVLKLKGDPDAVIQALVHGLPREALEQLRDAFGEELAKRRG